MRQGRWLGVGVAVIGLAAAAPGFALDKLDDAPEPQAKEHVTSDLPHTWFLTGNDKGEYAGGADQTVLFGGNPSGYIKSVGLNLNGYGTLASAQDATPFRGQTVRFSAFLKSVKVQNWAGLWIGVESPGLPFHAAQEPNARFNMMKHREPLIGTIDWKACNLDIVVPPDATRLLFGLVLSGRGTAYINRPSLDVVAPTPPSAVPDLNFAP